MRIVREIKKYSRDAVYSAMFYEVGYYWKRKQYVPRSIDKMLVGLSKPELMRVLFYLRSQDVGLN